MLTETLIPLSQEELNLIQLIDYSLCLLSQQNT